MKEGEILKKIVGVISVLSLLLIMSACSNSENDAKTSKSSVIESSSVATSDTYVANTKNLKAVVNELNSEFNKDGSNVVKVEVQDNVVDDTSSDPHSVIEVRVIDDATRKAMQETKDAVDSNNADDAQLTTIYDIQSKVESAAKKLESENDLVKYVNPDTDGNNIVIAMANKTENIVPLVK